MFEHIITYIFKYFWCKYYSPGMWNTVIQATRLTEFVQPCHLFIFRNTDSMEFCRFLVVVQIFDCSAREEHELCSSDKKKLNKYDLGRVSSNVYIPFPLLKSNFSFNWFFCRLLLSNAIRHHLPVRLLTFRLSVKFFCLLFTITVNLYSIANGIGFHNFWTHKSYGRFEQYLSRIWWDLGLTIHWLLYLTFLSVPRGSHWYQKARPIPPPSTFCEVNQF